MFADICAFNSLIIGGRISPDHRTENQINHMCIGQKFRRSMQDIRVQRGADTDSYHHLLLARMKLKLKKREIKRSTRTKYNVDFLKDREVTETFRLTINNKYEALQGLLGEENRNIDTPCKEILGKKKCQNKEWISADTISKVQMRKEKKGAINNSRTRAAKAAAQKQYADANRAVKKSI